MADKRDLKIKKRHTPQTRRDPSPMAWERAPRKKTVRVKKKPKPARDTVMMTLDETEAADLPAQTTRRKRRPGLRLLVRVAAFVLAVLVIALIWQNGDHLAPGNVKFWLDQTFSPGGDGFPVEISGNSVLDVQPVQSYLALLTDTSLVAFNANGGEVTRRAHNYAEPLLRVAGRYMLVAEIGGKRFRLETLPDTVLNVTADNLTQDKKSAVLDTPIDNVILSAAVRSDGAVALITTSTQSYTSEVLVYNAEGKLRYRQRYASVQATDVAFSPNGRDIAVVGIDAQNGAMQSVLRVHALSSQDSEPRQEFTGADVMISRVGYLSSGRIAAIGDTQAWVVSDNGSLDERIAYQQQLVGCAFGEKTVALALQKYGASDGGGLVLLDASGKTAFTAEFSGQFRHMTLVDGEWLMLTAGRLIRGDDSRVIGEAEVAQDGQLVGRLGRKAIVLGLTTLSEYDLPDHTAASETEAATTSTTRS
ncbi:MAG: DUF5711 family protein [Acutalibacteraceae bacterium]|jgi:hypothetical protein